MPRLRTILPVVALGLVTLLGGCVVYPAYPSYGYAAPGYGGGIYYGGSYGGGWRR